MPYKQTASDIHISSPQLITSEPAVPSVENSDDSITSSSNTSNGLPESEAQSIPSTLHIHSISPLEETSEITSVSVDGDQEPAIQSPIEDDENSSKELQDCSKDTGVSDKNLESAEGIVSPMCIRCFII